MLTAVEPPATNEARPRDIGGELSIWTFGRILLTHRRLLVGLTLLGGFGGTVVGLLSPKAFRASATFLPQSMESNVSSAGLAAIAASQLGVRLPNATQAWGADMYASLLGSHAVLEPIALDSIPVSELGGRKLAVLDLVNARAETEPLRVETAVRLLAGMVAVNEDKKLGTVTISVATRWPSVSLALVDRLLGRLNQFNLETRRSQAHAEREFVEQQTALADTALRRAEDRLKAFLQSNRVIGTPDLQFERDRLQRDVNARQQLFTELLDSREQARIREVRDTPVITVLEPARLPLVREPRHTAKKAAVGVIVGGATAVLVALLLNAVRADAEDGSADLLQFMSALEGALPALARRRG